MVFEVGVDLPMREVDRQGRRGEHRGDVRQWSRQRNRPRPQKDRDGRGDHGLALEVAEESEHQENGGDRDR